MAESVMNLAQNNINAFSALNKCLLLGLRGIVC